MVKHNPKKWIEKKFIFSLYYDGLEYICMKKYNVSQHIQKCKYTPKMIEMIFNFLEKFIVVISHFISHNLNQIFEPFEKFDNFHVIKEFFFQWCWS
jgi:hypothetical protein